MAVMVREINDISQINDCLRMRISNQQPAASSQQMTDWFYHGLVTEAQVEEAIQRKTAKMAKQSVGDNTVI